MRLEASTSYDATAKVGANESGPTTPAGWKSVREPPSEVSLEFLSPPLQAAVKTTAAAKKIADKRRIVPLFRVWVTLVMPLRLFRSVAKRRNHFESVPSRLGSGSAWRGVEPSFTGGGWSE